MKIPKTIKIPRKLKKELKKGVERRVRRSGPVMPDINSAISMYETVSYLGSGTKPYHRLCKYLRKEEKSIFREQCREAEKIIFSCDTGLGHSLKGIWEVKTQN